MTLCDVSILGLRPCLSGVILAAEVYIKITFVAKMENKMTVSLEIFQSRKATKKTLGLPRRSQDEAGSDGAGLRRCP